ncbi:MAG: class II D-tagatose-bisphosphate aldolase, non-catalytic subunit [Albidovulum sp.]|nr:class II D-tagatose-bisphosphate aldolase, non-catalytic subunit [Albidovulum sp.]
MKHPLFDIPAAFRNGEHAGIASVCSAHPLVVEAHLRLSLASGRPALIEATCNQVNQDGGYTGMTPLGFRRMVETIAGQAGIDPDRIILGGDHLGTNPWKALPAERAMANAEDMVAAYAEAGFAKLHLDTSMGCLNEPAALSDAVCAERAARLAAAAESRMDAGRPPVYVIGTEVPAPGGAVDNLGAPRVTDPEAAIDTYRAHRDAFGRLGLDDAFSRVVALVVQPGVEFGHAGVARFDAGKARALSESLKEMPGIVFEAHSTDYQTESVLRQLVERGFAILKVGPWLTFALREALYGLDFANDALEGRAPRGKLMDAMEEAMLEAPEFWRNYYGGTETEAWVQRHFSYSDRIRYYWPASRAAAAVEDLRSSFDSKKNVPEPLLRQFLPNIGAAPSGGGMESILISAVQQVLKQYERAVTEGDASEP